jgi:hypothetical protein
MTHRSKTGEGPVKAQHGKTATQKRHNGPKTHRRSSSVANLEAKVAQLTGELKEALQQQIATDRRRAQGHQPLGVRSAIGFAHTRQVSGEIVRR